MTRCPCSKNACRPSTSFFYKVLSSLKQLQTQKKYLNGANLDDIAKFMDKTYCLSGDILSQVENALNVAEACKFIIKKKNLYALLSPAASLQLTPYPCIKAKLERIQEIFNTKWCEENNTKKRSNRQVLRNSCSPPHFILPGKTKTNSNNKNISFKAPITPTTKQSLLKSSLQSFLNACRPGSSQNVSTKKIDNRNSVVNPCDPSSNSLREDPRRNENICRSSERLSKQRNSSLNEMICSPSLKTLIEQEMSKIISTQKTLKRKKRKSRPSQKSSKKRTRSYNSPQNSTTGKRGSSKCPLNFSKQSKSKPNPSRKSLKKKIPNRTSSHNSSNICSSSKRKTHKSPKKKKHKVNSCQDSSKKRMSDCNSSQQSSSMCGLAHKMCCNGSSKQEFYCADSDSDSSE